MAWFLYTEGRWEAVACTRTGLCFLFASVPLSPCTCMSESAHARTPDEEVVELEHWLSSHCISPFCPCPSISALVSAAMSAAAVCATMSVAVSALSAAMFAAMFAALSAATLSAAALSAAALSDAALSVAALSATTVSVSPRGLEHTDSFISWVSHGISTAESSMLKNVVRLAVARNTFSK